MRPKIKICGITNLIDAKNALKLGADYIGFINIEQSPRYLTIDQILEISRDLSEAEKQKSVLLTLENDTEALVAMLTKLGFKTLQPYGYLSKEDLSKLKLMGYKIFKPVQVASMSDIENLDDYRRSVDLIILDTKLADEKLGGTGKVFDWDIFVYAKEKLEIDLALSGGLNLENIAEAIEKTQPDMIDLSSGLESRPGQKSVSKMKDLFALFMSSSTSELGN